MSARLFLMVFVLSALAAAGAVGAFGASGNSSQDSGTASVQCLVDDGFQNSIEPGESPEYATVTVSPTTLWPPNGRMQTIGLSMSYVDPEDADTQSLTVLGISSDDGTSADWSGVGNTASGPADGSTVNTTVQLRAARSGTALTGRTYSITLQCAEGGTPPAGQNQVTVQVTVPHDQGQ